MNSEQNNLSDAGFEERHRRRRAAALLVREEQAAVHIAALRERQREQADGHGNAVDEGDDEENEQNEGEDDFSVDIAQFHADEAMLEQLAGSGEDTDASGDQEVLVIVMTAEEFLSVAAGEDTSQLPNTTQNVAAADSGDFDEDNFGGSSLGWDDYAFTDAWHDGHRPIRFDGSDEESDRSRSTLTTSSDSGSESDSVHGPNYEARLVLQQHGLSFEPQHRRPSAVDHYGARPLASSEDRDSDYVLASREPYPESLGNIEDQDPVEAMQRLGRNMTRAIRLLDHNINVQTGHGPNVPVVEGDVLPTIHMELRQALQRLVEEANSDRHRIDPTQVEQVLRDTIRVLTPFDIRASDVILVAHELELARLHRRTNQQVREFESRVALPINGELRRLVRILDTHFRTTSDGDVQVLVREEGPTMPEMVQDMLVEVVSRYHRRWADPYSGHLWECLSVHGGIDIDDVVTMLDMENRQATVEVS